LLHRQRSEELLLTLGEQIECLPPQALTPVGQRHRVCSPVALIAHPAHQPPGLQASDQRQDRRPVDRQRLRDPALRQQGRLRCIGAGRNWWSCVQVDDLGRAYEAALRLAPAGASYPIVDDEPVRLRTLTDLTTDALGLPRVGSAPPALVALFLGRPLVASLVTSFRVRGQRARDDLHWQPSQVSFAAGVAGATATLPATSE